jgi:uncharacterized membrane protein
MKAHTPFLKKVSKNSKKEGKMTAKIFYFFLIYTLTSIIIYMTTDFTFSKVFEKVSLLISGLFSTVFTYYLWRAIKNKTIKYQLDSVSSFVGFLAIVVIFFSFILFVIIYPTSYFLHKITKKPSIETMIIESKKDVVKSTRYHYQYRYIIYLKNNDIEQIAYLNDKQLSNLDYQKIHIGDIWKAKVAKSFFGFTNVNYEFKQED